ncbi:MAG: hypothetical protein GXO93_02455 [FCB group bacterium]|nr:hypothetical protein [FCB group bacterium]
MTKLHHYDKLGTVRFVTFSCYRRKQLFVTNESKKIFLYQLRTICTKYSIHILGYVVMPEHVHLVLYPKTEIFLGRVIGELKSISAREILLSFRGQYDMSLESLKNNEKYIFWLRRCYDHNCRTPETVKEKIVYCHKNPVTRGLVEKPEDWEWSSYRWYYGMDNVVIDIEGYNP